jgi:ATP-binding cassette subfamily C protein LapB
MPEENYEAAPAATALQDAFLRDPELAMLLSRLAALLGHAVPASRFGMQEHNRDGVELQQLPRLEQAREMWAARFAAGQCGEPGHASIGPADFPLLWMSECGRQLRLVRGRLSSGALAAEDAQGARQDIAAADAPKGRLLSLRPDSGKSGSAGENPRSAGDWFAFALRRQRRVFIDGVFATFMVNAIGLVASLYSMQVYDRVVPNAGYATLRVLTVGALIAVALEFIMKQVRAHMVDRATKVIDQQLSGVFFDKALGIRMDARPATVGTFAAQIRHFESVRNFLASSTLFVLADAPFALLFIGVMALIAGPVALVPLIMAPVSLMAGLWFRGAIERLTADSMAASNRKNGLLIDALEGIESLKAAGAEWKMLERYQALTATIAHSELGLKDLSARATHVAHMLQQLNYIGLIAAGAYAIGAGELSMGGLIACSLISGRALSPLAQIPQLVVQWKHAAIALGSLDAIMALPGDGDNGSGSGQQPIVPERCEGALTVQDAAFAYRDGKPMLEVGGLSFKPGERVAVLGAVGSGMSTLVKLLSGLYQPTAGAVYLDGVDMGLLAPQFVREHIGYLPEDVRLFNGTLRDNLTLGLPTPNDGVILRAASLTGLDQVIRNHPRGLALEIAEGGHGLSGGQRQLVGLTRLLLARPRVILLDEPTASMDAQLEARVMTHLFKEIADDAVLVVVTHKLAILPHVDRIVVVDRGRIIADGPRADIIARLRQGPVTEPSPESALQPAARQAASHVRVPA